MLPNISGVKAWPLAYRSCPSKSQALRFSVSELNTDWVYPIIPMRKNLKDCRLNFCHVVNWAYFLFCTSSNRSQFVLFQSVIHFGDEAPAQSPLPVLQANKALLVSVWCAMQWLISCSE